MIRFALGEPYRPERARQLRILLGAAAVVVVFLFGWAALLLLGHGSASTALLVLVVPGVLLGGLVAGALRAVSNEDPNARPWVAATGLVAIVVAVLLSQTFIGLLVAVVAVPLLLIGVLPGRDDDPPEPSAH
ncbi:hypothetical protein H5V45_21150 [Nocardioides sp. KIGAM211]|uniref:Uncharacterized protein n=1 Tax=Nocardioides luti TaxID=2761101 RepID=A0A7X0RMK5_9ACTN|nr:hypothetical protein [Nocardioides luti]MBB6629839.1 hypothetical protein [Nocardioides luti]